MSSDERGDDQDIPLGGIAIIGMAGRFPGARNVDEFWRNLCSGVESITRFSAAELEDSFDETTRAAPNFVKARPILEDVDQFDAEFFGMYAREAELTDPQHRVFLECSWEALEDAGYDPAVYRGAVGVFAGSSFSTYFLNNVCADRSTIDEFTSNYQVGCYPMLLGAAQDFLATRVAYKLDLKGPSLTLQSGCSTSLLAVAKACQSLLLYESDMALAGGVSITFPQKRGYQHLEGGMVSADGTCRPFDADANGTIFGSGAGVVLLKRLEDAIADGDHIYALIRGSGVNNDGASKVGFTAPSADGQAAVIEMALAAAGVEARSISYVECHGTATPMGDPIEVAGLSKAFAASTSDRRFCAIGSVKSNVGHLDVAAGITGLIKTALALKHQTLPPSLHYRRPNPRIDFSTTPFYVNTSLADWPQTGTPRRAGVSAFGVGGTNVHVVLEEAPTGVIPVAPPSDAAQLLVLSARTPAALAQARIELAAHLRSHESLALSDVAYALQTGRRAFDARTAIVARDRADALNRLTAADGGGAQTGTRIDPAPRVVFMFPGQGAQYPDMGRDLYEREPEFRRHITRCADILRPLMQEDLRDLLYPSVNSDEAKRRLMATLIAQPAIFTVEYALARLWMSWGIQPQAMIGHSVGEFVAAVIAGVLSLEDALALVAARGKLMQDLPGGAMLAVRLPEAQVRELLPPTVSIAAINGPALCVVSGPVDAVDDTEKMLQSRNVATRRLHTSHAFHSAMVEPVVEPLRRQLGQVELSAPTIPYVSCVTGTWIRPEQAISPDYWARHAREIVRFADGIATLAADPSTVLLEVGPGNVLSTLALQCTRGRGLPVIASMQDAVRETTDGECLLRALGHLWTTGAVPDWTAVHGVRRSHVPLPTYPFQRKRHWIDAPVTATKNTPTAPQDTTPEWRGVDPATAVVIQPQPTQETSAMNQSSAQDHINETRSLIAAIFEDLSGERPESTDSDTSFLEMGYDSLFLTQVAQKLQSKTGVKITFRQLLGDYATIPTLAAFLAEKMPKPAAKTAPAPTPAVSATAAPAAPALPTVPFAAAASALRPTLTAPGAPIPGIEGLFREQLLAVTQLINRQVDVLQGLGLSPAQQPVAAAAPTVAVPAAAQTPAPQPTAAAAVAVAVAVADDAAPAEEQRPSRFSVYKPVQRSADNGIKPEHQKHIDELIARYTAKTPGSKRETGAHRAISADPRAAAGFRNEWKEMVYPIVVKTCAGSKLYDVDGNEYIDLVNGYGQTAFGHAPPFVVEAVKKQLDQGFAIGPQSELTGKVAALFAELTGNERVTFCNTGSEAVMAAMRVARTVTGREKIVVFNGDYHGQFDEVLVKGVQRPGAPPRSQPVAPGIPSSAVQNMIVLEYGSAQTLKWIRENAEDLAAVVIEPIQSRHPNLQPFEFLRELRAITEASGTAFVMDEVVTGFRVHPGGMQSVIGIRADMATYGKVVGGGLPVGVLAGKRKFMDALDGGPWNYGDESFPETGVTFFAGTFVRHPLLLASAWAVLNHLKDAGPALQQTLTGKTARLVERLSALFADRGMSTKIETYSSFFYFNVHNEHPLATLLYYHLRERGIHIQDGFPCFLTTAHSDEDFDRIYAAFESAIDELNAVGILGKPRTASAQSIAATQAPALGPVPLTESQIEIWLSAQLGDEASCAFNESVSLRMRGRLNTTALQTALSLIVNRHDALRATFSSTGEEMHIGETREFAYPFTDLSAMPAADAELAYASLLDTDARTAFDLVAGPVIRAHLVKLGADEHALMVTAHHIVCDGWSLNVIVSELSDLYGTLCRGEAPALPPAMPFSAYARSQASRDAAELAATEQFWLAQFKDRVQPLELPTDRPRPTVKSFSGASLCRRIDAKLYQAVKKAGARQKSTLFVTLLSAFQVLMGRFSKQSEVVVGVPTAGQSLLEDQILVGHCVNFLPIRGSWSRDTNISDYLSSMAKRVLDAYEHQNYTFGTLVRKLAWPREAGRLPLAEIQFNLERLSDRIQLPDLTIDVSPNAKAHVNFDLFLNVIESADGLRMDCDYNTDLFDAATIDHWLDCYQALLESIVADAAQPLVRASCVPAAELKRLIVEMNATAAEYPRDTCMHRLFEAQAAAAPSAIAVQFGSDTLTYQALDLRSNQLANLLLERLGPTGRSGRLVGVAVERSLDMLVAMLAVHKAGGAYVPLDPMHPPARLKHILGEAEVVALIADGSDSVALVGADIPVINVQTDAAAIATASSAAPRATATASDLAYVMYTSGSTGLPKGVEISHRALVNLLHSMAKRPGLSRQDVFFAVTTISFDIAGLELFLPLIVGAKVVIAEREAVMDGFKLLENLQSVGATAMQATPATWRMLLEAGFSAKPGFKMLCGGEALPRELANRLLEGSGQLWNMYGPTETTIWSSCVQIESGLAPVTVGGPIDNTQFYILDANDQPVPFGVPGQLHIGGDGVAQGYYKRPELTADKFLPNPFAAGRIYRTGDLARWLPDGGLQVLGRIDHQIKLRGFRIELGEIESVLMKKAQLAEATVMLREDVPGSPRLVAYYVESVGNTRTAEVLRALLAEDMPEYMIPAAWVRMEALPLTPNGKLDRAALPVPDSSQVAKQEYVAPTSPTEVALTKIFCEVLHLDEVGVTADLLKLGADSIQLFQITARANRAGIKITAKQLLQLRTAAALAAVADSKDAEPAPAGGPAPTLPTLGQFQRSRRAGSTVR